MNKGPIFSSLLTLLFLSGCASTVIADLQEDKVTVQANHSDLAAIKQVAAEGCAVHERNAIGPISARPSDYYGMVSVYLFACREQDVAPAAGPPIDPPPPPTQPPQTIR